MTGPVSGKRRSRPAPLSIRLSDDERRKLAELAGDQPVSAYIKHVVLERGQPVRRTRKVTVDRELAARVLAILGQSGIGTSLAQLADHAASGSLDLDDRTSARLLDACEDVQAVRELLMLALGKEPGGSVRPGASSAFDQASGGGAS